MRRIGAIGLIATLIGHQVLSAKVDPSEPAGPIGRSALAEAFRLAADPRIQPVGERWRAVREIEPGSSIEITTRAGRITRVFVAADDSSMIVLRLALPGISERSASRLTDLAASHPDVFVNAAAGLNQRADRIRLEDGVAIVDGVNAATINELIEAVPARDVVVVSRSIRRGSGAAAAFGTIGGIYLGSLLATSVISANCSHSGSCRWIGPLAFVTVIGVPVLTGYGSWRASSRVIQEVVYP